MNTTAPLDDDAISSIGRAIARLQARREHITQLVTKMADEYASDCFVVLRDHGFKKEDYQSLEVNFETKQAKWGAPDKAPKSKKLPFKKG